MKFPFSHSLRRQSGLTLIEVVVAIVLIGVALPTLTAHFSGMATLNIPEQMTQGAFLGARQLEAISNEPYSEMPAAGAYTCAAFAAAKVSGTFDIVCNDPDYPKFQYAWLVQDVAADDLNTPLGSPGFGKKITLTVTHTDGELPPLEFVALF